MEDCLRIIFTELEEDSASLYSCILVNRFWCRIAIPILWKNPFIYFVYGKISRDKLCNVIIHLLPQSSKQLLFDNNIDLPPSSTFSNEPLFNYISFFSHISPYYINDMIQTLTNKEEEKYLLKQEIYKLFINNCNNIKEFSLNTDQPLFQYPGASTFFSQLCYLEIDLQSVTSTVLFGMGQVCQNIEGLIITFRNGNISGLINLIDVQKNLRILYLDLRYRNLTNQCNGLSEVIERKATTLKYLKMKQCFAPFSPKFLPSLINLQYLEIKDGYEINESTEWQEWKKYLSIASFPNLQYLRTASFPCYEDYMLIEKSHGNLLEINIDRAYGYQDFTYNKKLIKAVAKNCPRIKRLMIDVDPKNLDGIKEIFLNCRQLEKIRFSSNNKVLICDELLEIIVKFSPAETFCEFFSINWNFSVNGLQSFFENWRGRIPLKFNYYYCEKDFWTEQHLMIVEKYRKEGVIN
ncbi:hypothetical protein C1645_116470 [Glomus cerebriforme]|uniref:F-box domain-containing protein n=1 Tax=Glomus cerebriforme TaxID=658196 RepID=A0A397T152_9GLOM|nr:hypothetical protein C1645_116470 [Glomus cerebriforme]